MPVIDAMYANGEKGKKYFSLEHKAEDGILIPVRYVYGNMHVCCFYKNDNDSYSLWRIEQGKYAYEDFILINKSGKIEVINSVSNTRNVLTRTIKFNESGENFVSFSEFYEKFFKNQLVVRWFNSVCHVNTSNIYILINLIEKAIRHEVELPALKPIEEKIPQKLCSMRENTKSSSVIFTSSFIERIGEDETMLRIFSLYRGEVFEHSRIWTKGSKSVFLMYLGEIWSECVDNISASNMDFTICGADELDGTYIGNITKHIGWGTGRTRDICLSLFCPAFENLIEMGASRVLEAILTISQGDLMNIKGNRTLLGDVAWDASSFADFIGYPSYIIADMNTNYQCINIVFNRLVQYMVKEYIRTGNKERSKKLIALLSMHPKTLTVAEYCMLLRKCCDKGVDLLKQVEYIDSFKNSRSDIITYYDYIDMLDILEKDEAKRNRFNTMPDIKTIREEHDRILDYMEYKRTVDEFNTPEVKKKFISLAKKHECYLFKFKELHISIPKSPDDLFEEGKKLHHCVATYIEKVANGETVILFIRKDKTPDEPFYTLEIREGKVRQCHGMCNCDVTGEVEEFLKEFCKEKEISFSLGKEVLCV